MNLNKTYLLTVSVEEVDNFFSCLTDRTHSDDYAVSVLSTIVVEELVVCATDLIDLIHVSLNLIRYCKIERVGSFSALEVDIRVLSCTTKCRVVRREGSLTEFLDCIVINEGAECIVVDNFDLLDLVRCTETVEEVNERNSCLDGSEVSYCSKVCYFLNGVGAEHCKTGLTASIYVCMVTKDVQRMSCKSSGGNVEYAREKLTCDLVHIRDHQEKTLGCGISSCQSTCCQRAVNSTCCTSLRLHLDDIDRLSEDVLSALLCPLVGVISHRRGRCDRVNRCVFGKCI